MVIGQYQIVLVNLDPTQGAGIQKTRPCIVISPDELNRHLQTVTVCPVTRVMRQYPTRIKFSFRNQFNWIVVDQIRTIDRRRIIKTLGQLKPETIVRLKNVIRETFVD